jgi:hypothetical protein
MHRKTLCLASLLLAGGLAVLPTDVVGQQKRAEPGTFQKFKPVPATEQDYHFIDQAKQVTGTILSFDDSAKTLSVRIDATDSVPNQNYKMAKQKNPNNVSVKPLIHPKDFELELQEKVVYRKMNLIAEYDTGKLKTLSKDEIAKLKGSDSSKPGYTATASEFHAGQIVFVYLSAAKKSKEDQAAKPTVRMLIIHKDGTAPTAPMNPK